MFISKQGNIINYRLVKKAEESTEVLQKIKEKHPDLIENETNKIKEAVEEEAVKNITGEKGEDDNSDTKTKDEKEPEVKEEVSETPSETSDETTPIEEDATGVSDMPMDAMPMPEMSDMPSMPMDGGGDAGDFGIDMPMDNIPGEGFDEELPLTDESMDIPEEGEMSFGDDQPSDEGSSTSGTQVPVNEVFNDQEEATDFLEWIMDNKDDEMFENFEYSSSKKNGKLNEKYEIEINDSVGDEYPNLVENGVTRITIETDDNEMTMKLFK